MLLYLDDKKIEIDTFSCQRIMAPNSIVFISKALAIKIPKIYVRGPVGQERLLTFIKSDFSLYRTLTTLRKISTTFHAPIQHLLYNSSGQFLSYVTLFIPDTFQDDFLLRTIPLRNLYPALTTLKEELKRLSEKRIATDDLEANLLLSKNDLNIVDFGSYYSVASPLEASKINNDNYNRALLYWFYHIAPSFHAQEKYEFQHSDHKDYLDFLKEEANPSETITDYMVKKLKNPK